MTLNDNNTENYLINSNKNLLHEFYQKFFAWILSKNFSIDSIKNLSHKFYQKFIA